MARITFDLLIIYRNRDRKIVRGVENYGVSDSTGCFYYEKNGFRSFIPVNQVQFFGRAFDYGED